MSAVSIAQVSKHLKFRQVRKTQSNADFCNRPLVIFFTWLGASEKAIDRYCHIYHQVDCDVLTVQGTTTQFLWPIKAKELSVEVLEFLQNHSPDDPQPLIVHGVSVGAFNYTVFFMELAKSPSLFKSVTSRIKAQVFDSPVVGSLSQMVEGIANAATKNRCTNTLVRTVVQAYLDITKSYSVSYYEKCIAAVYSNPVTSPALLMYSLNDQLMNAAAMEAMIRNWKVMLDRNVWVKCWRASAHAGHLTKHRDDYIHTLYTFLKASDINISHNASGLSKL